MFIDKLEHFVLSISSVFRSFSVFVLYTDELRLNGYYCKQPKFMKIETACYVNYKPKCSNLSIWNMYTRKLEHFACMVNITRFYFQDLFLACIANFVFKNADAEIFGDRNQCVTAACCSLFYKLKVIKLLYYKSVNHCNE
jgi:hypothetical protein